MKALSLVLLMPIFAFAAKPPAVSPKSLSPEESTSCAKVALAAVYGGQKSYYSEFERYHDSFEEIGYLPEEGPCKSEWDLSLRTFNGGKEFLGRAVHRNSGETWTINQDKIMVQEHGRR